MKWHDFDEDRQFGGCLWLLRSEKTVVYVKVYFQPEILRYPISMAIKTEIQRQGWCCIVIVDMHTIVIGQVVVAVVDDNCDNPHWISSVIGHSLLMLFSRDIIDIIFQFEILYDTPLISLITCLFLFPSLWFFVLFLYFSIINTFFFFFFSLSLSVSGKPTRWMAVINTIPVLTGWANLLIEINQ